MIEKRIDELFESIYTSREYLDYEKAKKIIAKNIDITTKIEEIKKLQQDATKLQYNKDSKYMDIDELLEIKKNELNNICLYQDYLDKKEELNNVLAIVSNMINKYIIDKVN